MAHDHLIELLDLDAEVLHEYFRDVIGWVGREAAERPHVVDLGAGSGTGSLALARELPDSTITAVDLSPEMLAHLRGRADAAGLGDRIRTVEADLDQPWPDLGPVEVIWAAASMHHMADPATAVASACGALRPGGLLVIAELDSFPHFLTGTADEEVERRGHAEAAKRRHEAGLHMHENWGERMRQAGFTSVTERHFDIDLRPPLPAATTRYAHASLSRMRHGLEERLSARDLAALEQVVAGLATRADLSVRTGRTVWLARR
ncbi:Methyltransferase domain-containing protein [Micromonospora matsumotoense]|uniref:Methyltransferase domain-containing protein n=1 Tax=Micromonospora matsumotoense TaxID=121616 RepID=A0A1C5ANX8_9ACTN|nr:class I SAM-dependent methyltransferase [Micromonospora matsumotoense]SCF46771.1 Methyltransferase domain-containing protein [Micromonospora matsumotoense]